MEVDLLKSTGLWICRTSTGNSNNTELRLLLLHTSRVIHPFHHTSSLLLPLQDRLQRNSLKIKIIKRGGGRKSKKSSGRREESRKERAYWKLVYDLAALSQYGMSTGMKKHLNSTIHLKVHSFLFKKYT